MGIPKTKGIANTSDKNCAITLSSSVEKLFDLMLLAVGKDSLQTDYLQFGLKNNSSTPLCTAVLHEINSYFTSNGSKVFGLFLDASKAFDRVNFTKLFRLLISRGLNALFIRFLLNLYTRQTLQVNWNGIVTDSFNVFNDMKQGGVLSPVLFCIYPDAMLEHLRLSGYGCSIGLHFTGALAYADDVVLLSPTYNELKRMSEICLQYAKEYDILFNAAKSQFIVFDNGKSDETISFGFGGAELHQCSQVNHLGHQLHANIKEYDLDGIIASFYKQFNSFRSKFATAPSVVQSELFVSYCSSFLDFYYCPLKSV